MSTNKKSLSFVSGLYLALFLTNIRMFFLRLYMRYIFPSRFLFVITVTDRANQKQTQMDRNVPQLTNMESNAQKAIQITDITLWSPRSNQVLSTGLGRKYGIKFARYSTIYIFQGSGRGPTIFQGVQLFPEGVQLPIPYRNPYILVIFQGGGGVRTPCPPSGSAIEICQNMSCNANSSFIL